MPLTAPARPANSDASSRLITAADSSSSVPVANRPSKVTAANRVAAGLLLSLPGTIRVSESPGFAPRRAARPLPNSSPLDASLNRRCSAGSSAASSPSVCAAGSPIPIPVSISRPRMNRASNWTKGCTDCTSGRAARALATGCQSTSGSVPYTVMCGTSARIRSRISLSKPFITDSTATSRPIARISPSADRDARNVDRYPRPKAKL